MYTNLKADVLLALGGVLTHEEYNKAKKAVTPILDEYEGKMTDAIGWSRDDVLAIANESDIELTDEEADEVLKGIIRAHDASIGINWDVISSHLDMYAADREEGR
jgi:hypothetical protein